MRLTWTLPHIGVNCSIIFKNISLRQELAMPTDSANVFNWWYLLLLVPAAIYYGIRIFDSLKKKNPAQTDGLGDQTRVGARVGSVVRIEQRELSNRPPFILSFVLLICAIFLFALGVLAMYTWVAGIAEFRISYEYILFLMLLIGFLHIRRPLSYTT